MDRCLTRSRIVIFDTHNNIKGYRYQLWCIARQVGHAGWSAQAGKGLAWRHTGRAAPQLRCEHRTCVLTNACLPEIGVHHWCYPSHLWCCRLPHGTA